MTGDPLAVVPTIPTSRHDTLLLCNYDTITDHRHIIVGNKGPKKKQKYSRTRSSISSSNEVVSLSNLNNKDGGGAVGVYGTFSDGFGLLSSSNK